MTARALWSGVFLSWNKFLPSVSNALLRICSQAFLLLTSTGFWMRLSYIWNTSLPAGPRIWPEMRYLNNYWMDCREIQCRHSYSPGHLAQSSTVASLTTAEVTLERLFHTLNCFLSLWLLWHRAVCFPFKTHTLPFFLSVSYFLTCLSRYLCSLSLSCHPILLSLPALWHTSSHLFSFSCSFSVSVAPAVCLSFIDTPLLAHILFPSGASQRWRMVSGLFQRL